MGTPGLKLCGCCRKTFRPQFSEEDLRDLYFEEDQLERMEAMAKEYPTHFQMPHVPTQDLCVKCASDPDLVVSTNIFGPTRYEIRRPEAERKTVKLKVRGEASRGDMIVGTGAALSSWSPSPAVDEKRVEEIVEKVLSKKKTLWERLFGRKR